jgi:superfamily I DNA/RNA helicase
VGPLASDAAADQLLAGLNPPQREAVLHGSGPLLILAGAGSGKTRVLTHRIAYLVRTGRAHPHEILAITFTNKAAAEMRERVERLLGRATRGMWLTTFHSACVRMLRANAERLGYRRGFTIYDDDDSQRLVKRCLEELDLDPKRFAPRAIKRHMSDAKNRLVDHGAYRETAGSVFEHAVADVYELYDRRAQESNAMDFDDLLVRCVDLLEAHDDVREGYGRAFKHVLVDEYQDTNRAQYRWLQLLAGAHRNLAVVGDDDQCLVEGTLVTMADGSQKPIEDVRVGDEVLSGMGQGRFGPARVARVHRARGAEGIAIRLRGGAEVVSTPEHVHFAGYRRGVTPQLHTTYLMRKQGCGFRLGTSRVYTNGQAKPMLGFKQRAVQEHADAAWVVSTHTSEAEARAAEVTLSLRYQLPTLPFVARRGGKAHGLVADQALIDRVFASVDTDAGGRRLVVDAGLSEDFPHHVPQSHEGRRRNVVITLCAQNRSGTPMHAIAIGGRDPEVAAALQEAGLSVRLARPGSTAWRYESAFKDYAAVEEVLRRIESVVDVTVRRTARLGRGESGGSGGSLPFVPASAVRPGMAMFTGDGGFDVVESVERVPLDCAVYDLDVERTHNFVANGVVTHNSIYSFRSADIRNILDFERDFPDAVVVKLEQNYRSTQTILSAANAVIANNADRKDKSLWTDLGQGEPIHVRELEDEFAEARFVVGEIERRVDEGESRDETAVFYRTNAQSRVIEEVLVRYGIRYQVVGGRKFYERKEIRDALAYLAFLVNPSDALAFARIAGAPKRGIGDTTVARVVGHANTLGEPVWDVARAPDRIPGCSGAAVKAVGRFMETMEGLRERMAEEVPVGELLDELLNEVGYLEALQAERTVEAESRLDNLRELVEGAREFAASAEEPSVEGYLQAVQLRSDQDELEDEAGKVTLMTLHSAKGLEFPVVFVVGMEDGVFPSSRAIEAGDLEEERRLCYVGMTRAMRELYLTFARTRRRFGGPPEWNAPSRFLGEVPQELTDVVHQEPSPARRAATWGGGAPAPAMPAGRREPSPPTAQFAVGDDVTHAKFGEGVVIAREPGGIVVVRFPSEGEKKLMEDYAPLRRLS